MQFPTAFLALTSLAIAATIPDTDTPSDVATMANTNGAVHDLPEGTTDDKRYPLLVFYNDINFKGTFHQVGYDTETTDNPDTTFCHNEKKSKTSSIKFVDLGRKIKCLIYNQSSCNYILGRREIDRSIKDLRKIYWNDKITSIKCYWV